SWSAPWRSRRKKNNKKFPSRKSALRVVPRAGARNTNRLAALMNTAFARHRHLHVPPFTFERRARCRKFSEVATKKIVDACAQVHYASPNAQRENDIPQ